MSIFIQKNKKAYHDYFIIEEIEAGIKLKGSEVKSIRKGNLNLKGSFCKFFNEKIFLFDCHISKYENQNSWDTFSETRERELLLNKKQILKWKTEIERNNGYTIVPLSIYFNDKNLCKMKIGLVKGKKDYDKRESQKEKDIKRKIQQKNYE